MTDRQHSVLVGLAAVLILAIVGHAWVSYRVDRAQANQVKQDMQPVHQEAVAAKDSAAKSEVQNQKELTLLLAAIASQKQQPIQTQVDYDRLAEMVVERMGVKPEVKPTVDANGKPLPDAASVTVQAKPLRDYMLECDAKQARLESCQKTVQNSADSLAAEVKDHQATKKELDAERKVNKGGSFMQRVKRNAKWFAVGAAAGAALGYAARR